MKSQLSQLEQEKLRNLEEMEQKLAAQKAKQEREAKLAEERKAIEE